VRLTRVISSLLGAAATPPAPEVEAKQRIEPVPAGRARGQAAETFAAAFPTQSARAALLDECVEKAQERAKLIEAATRS
jgi:hypothetical protein